MKNGEDLTHKNGIGYYNTIYINVSMTNTKTEILQEYYEKKTKSKFQHRKHLILKVTLSRNQFPTLFIFPISCANLKFQVFSGELT